MRKLAIIAALALLTLPLYAADDQSQHIKHMAGDKGHALPLQPGQGAFAAIAEIVQILETNPETDWSKVNIEALRQHLIDMSTVTLNAEVTEEILDMGVRFTVSGTGSTVQSIQRMVTGHAATMGKTGPWNMLAKLVENGAILEVTSNESSDATKIAALGFSGIMTQGMHHQAHHWMIATGGNPH